MKRHTDCPTCRQVRVMADFNDAAARRACKERDDAAIKIVRLKQDKASRGETIADLRAKLTACEQEAADYHVEITRMNAKLTACDKERDELREIAAMRDYGNARPSPFTAVANRAVKAEAEAARLREALEWYADKANYAQHVPAVWSDHGNRARAALAQRGGT